LLVNLAGLYLLREGRHGNLNVRGAWLHVLTDALGSAQAIGAAAVIWTFGWAWVDPIASILIALLVAYSSWSLLRQSVGVLMEGTPAHIDPDAVIDALRDRQPCARWSTSRTSALAGAAAGHRRRVPPGASR
jgi:cobalt-zinc-cadmium efflux system protein